MPDLFTAALDYAAHGLPVFPCLPRGKAPAVQRGVHAATTNPATIRRHWSDLDRSIRDSNRRSVQGLGARH